MAKNISPASGFTSAFAHKLKELRKKRKLTMKQLAQLLHVSESFISRLESGERQPAKELILQMGPLFFPDGNDKGLDELLISADYTPLHLERMTGTNDVVGLFQNAVDENPANFRAYLALVISLIKLGRYSSAREKIQQGLQQFDQSLVQLQALHAALELAQGNFESALDFQQSALRYFALDSNPEALQIKQEDLLLNLAVIYFIRGYQGIDAYLAAEAKGHKNQAHKHQQQALSDLMRAHEELVKALQIAPNDVYILDEYARVNFNLAYLVEDPRKNAYPEAIRAFRTILYSDQKHRLSYNDLLESSVFLIHAYAKNGQFDEAEQNINLMECCLPNYWLIHYIKACFFSLKYSETHDDSLLERGLTCLRIAASISDNGNRTRDEGMLDPDLAALREQKLREFTKIIKESAEA
jgi:transcriptional regulator with XRE-family HTH domain